MPVLGKSAPREPSPRERSRSDLARRTPSAPPGYLAGASDLRSGSYQRFEIRPRRADGVLGSWFSTCANPECSSGWLRLWRSRAAPVFEGGWCCSAACTQARVEAAVHRELALRGSQMSVYRHRVPLGLVMLEQGWITSEQLRGALEAQRAAGPGQGRLGDWLVEGQGVDEQLVTRALGLQWSCPVLPLEHHDPDAMAWAMPRLFVEAFGALPLRVAAGQILYLGFEDRLDPVLNLGLERMLQLKVESGLVRASLFRAAHRRMLHAAFPRSELLEASSEAALARVLARAVERARPVEARLVRIHDCLWLRMWVRELAAAVPGSALPASRDVEDVVCSLAAN